MEKGYSEIPSLDMTGKVAVITGGSSGIGFGVAKAMAHYGASVVIASIPKDECDDAANEIASMGSQCIGIPTDVSEEGQVENLIEKAVEHFGEINVFVSNAGIGGQVLPILEQTESDFEEVVKVNLKGVFLCGRAAAAQMIKQGKGGRIINTASIAAIEGGGYHGPYGAAKGGVCTLTRTMAHEWAPHRITVNAVCPGLTRTRINEEILKDPDLYNSLINKIPLNRMATVEEIAGLFVYLASDSAGFITGTAIIADGGATIGG